MTTEVRRNEAASRYELLLDGSLVGVADYYRDKGDRVVIPHTEIDAARRGHGLGAILVQGVLDDIRVRQAKIVPECWYVADFVKANPEYRDLVA